MHILVALWLAIAGFTSVVEVPSLELYDEPDRRIVVACEARGRATITWAPSPTLQEWREAFEEARTCAEAGPRVSLAEPRDVRCELVAGVERCSGVIR